MLASRRWKARTSASASARLAPFGQQQRGGLHRLPLGPQRLDDGRQHQPLDVGARGEVCAQLVPLRRVQRAHQQRAEDGRLHVAPIGLRGLDQQLELVRGQRQRDRVFEQAAVEVGHGHAQRHREAAARHGAPQLLDQGREAGRVAPGVGQELGERALGQQAHVLGEHGEQAAHQEARHLRRRVSGLQRLRQPRQPVGDLARHPGAAPRRVQAQRVEPDRGQQGAHLGVGQVGQADAVMRGVGEGDVVAAAAAELGVERDGLAHVHDDQERRPAVADLLGGQVAGVALRLLVGARHGRVPGRGAAHRRAAFAALAAGARPRCDKAPPGSARSLPCLASSTKQPRR